MTSGGRYLGAVDHPDGQDGGTRHQRAGDRRSRFEAAGHGQDERDDEGGSRPGRGSPRTPPTGPGRSGRGRATRPGRRPVDRRPPGTPAAPTLRGSSSRLTRASGSMTLAGPPAPSSEASASVASKAAWVRTNPEPVTGIGTTGRTSRSWTMVAATAPCTAGSVEGGRASLRSSVSADAGGQHQPGDQGDAGNTPNPAPADRVPAAARIPARSAAAPRRRRSARTRTGSTVTGMNPTCTRWSTSPVTPTAAAENPGAAASR